MKENFTEFLLKHFGIFLYFLLTNTFCLVFFIYTNHINSILVSIRVIKTSFIALLLLILIAFFIAYVIKNIIYYICKNKANFIKIIMGGGINLLIIYNLFITITNYILISKFNNYFNHTMLDAILHTNQNETLEFIQTYIGLYDVFIIILISTVSYFLIKINITKNINYKLNFLFIFLILGIFFLNDFRKAFINNNYSRYLNISFINFNNTIFNKNNYIIDANKMKQSYIEIFSKHENIQAKENIKNIILIIGESSRKDAYEIYGQILKTNPQISKINNKIAYEDVISPYHTTNPAMGVILNFANYENLNLRKHYENLDLISLFKLANYKTFWISNQDYIGVFGNNAATVGDLADFKYFSNKNMDSKNVINFAKYDEVLLPMIKNLKLNENNLIVIHIMGNHSRYKQRYPKNFKLFTHNDININLKKSKKQTIAEYYNSILYTDFIISEIYKSFQNDDSLIIYLSDHGESLWDDKTKSILGHSINDKTIAEIPFIIFYSNSFKQKHSELLDKLIKTKNLPFMTDDLIHVLCDIAGIDILEYEPSRSIINENYNKNRIRMFANEVDYDKYLKYIH